MKKWIGSFSIIIISLFTPILVWLLLYFLAHIKAQAFDPNPMVQSLVNTPRTISQTDHLTRWIHLVGKDGTWSIKNKDGHLEPLEKLDTRGELLILLVEAQGPTLAMGLYHFLKDKNLIEKVIILSNSDGILKDLRFHDPTFTLSAGQAFIIRFHALQRLGLEGLLTIDMSAIWLDPRVFGDKLQELTDFFTARKVAVFIGPNAPSVSNELEKKANLLVD